MTAIAAVCCTGLGLAVWVRKPYSPASLCFFIGMLVLAADNTIAGLSFQVSDPEKMRFWVSLDLIARSFLPGVWLFFSIVYWRGNYREFLARSWLLLLLAFLLPIGVSTWFGSALIRGLPYFDPAQTWRISFSLPGNLLNGLILIGDVLILMNLERTFRSAVGTIQWRIKFPVLGLAVIFGARVYTATQAMLFSGYDLTVTSVDAGAVIIGCILLAIGYLRSGFSEIDIYPSRTVLYTSLTALLVGGYLVVVGVLAQIVAHVGGARAFQMEALLILLALVVLTVLMLSKRLQQNLQTFVSHHFKRPQHDVRQVWSRFTQCTSDILNQDELLSAVVKLISETFGALSVTVWLLEQHKDGATCAASTSTVHPVLNDTSFKNLSAAAVGSLITLTSRPFDLETADGEVPTTLRRISSTQFRGGGNRLCITLHTAERVLGWVVLADRVGGISYTIEELDLLECIGEQIAATLSKLRLTREIVLAKELEAFQTLSAFFVHDLKNTASTLSLMLQNLPLHFGDPVFREDALRGIRKTIDRIHELIERVGTLRREVELRPTEFDFNSLIQEVVENLNGAVSSSVELVVDLQPIPKLVGDREQLRSVVTNLILNARDAVGQQGRIVVGTSESDDCATLSVSDTGCGMTPIFLRDGLFRPFHTTKKKGLGIGMFQSKAILEAHHGTIQVQSEHGAGTTFHITLPLKSRTQ